MSIPPKSKSEVITSANLGRLKAAVGKIVLMYNHPSKGFLMAFSAAPVIDGNCLDIEKACYSYSVIAGKHAPAETEVLVTVADVTVYCDPSVMGRQPLYGNGNESIFVPSDVPIQGVIDTFVQNFLQLAKVADEAILQIIQAIFVHIERRV